MDLNKKVKCFGCLSCTIYVLYI